MCAALQKVQVVCLLEHPEAILWFFNYQNVRFRAHLMDFKNGYIIKCIYVEMKQEV